MNELKEALSFNLKPLFRRTGAQIGKGLLVSPI